MKFPLVQRENLLQSIFGKWIKILQKEITSYKSRETNCSFLLSNKHYRGYDKMIRSDYKIQKKIIIFYMNFKIVNVQTDLVNRIWLQRESKFSKMLSQVGIYYYNKYNKYNLSFGERRATRQRRITEQKAPIAIHRPATRKSRDLDTFYHWIASRMTTKKARNRMVYENILLSYFILF